MHCEGTENERRVLSEARQELLRSGKPHLAQRIVTVGPLRETPQALPLKGPVQPGRPTLLVPAAVVEAGDVVAREMAGSVWQLIPAFPAWEHVGLEGERPAQGQAGLWTECLVRGLLLQELIAVDERLAAPIPIVQPRRRAAGVGLAPLRRLEYAPPASGAGDFVWSGVADDPLRAARDQPGAKALDLSRFQASFSQFSVRRGAGIEASRCGGLQDAADWTWRVGWLLDSSAASHDGFWVAFIRLCVISESHAASQ